MTPHLCLAAVLACAAPDELTVGTFNVEWLLPAKVHMKFGHRFELEGDDARTWAAAGYRADRFEQACDTVADYIAASLDADVLVLQEIGDRDAVAALVAALAERGADYPHWDVCDSTDELGQHVAVLSRRPFRTVRHGGRAVIPGWETYQAELDDADTEMETDVAKGIHVRLTAGARPLNLIGLHLKSERGGHESDAWRIAQASIVRRYCLPYLQRGEHVVITGDLNDKRGQPAIRRIRGQDDIFEDLLQTGQSRFFDGRWSELDQRYTYVFRGVRGQIDHVLISRSVLDDCGIEGITPVFHAVNEAVSDHRPLLVRFAFSGEPLAAARHGGHPMLGAAVWQQSAVEFRMVCEEVFRRATERLGDFLDDRDSLADPQHPPTGVSRSGPEKVAVVMDVDSTLLDGTPYTARLAWSGVAHTDAAWIDWCLQAEADAVPGSIAFARAVQRLDEQRDDLDLQLFLVTNRDAVVESATLENLDRLGLQVDAEHLLCFDERPEWDRHKTSRRAHVAALGYRIAMIVGDDLNDFTPARDLDRAQRETLYLDHEDYVGAGHWIVVPNATWGSWVRAALRETDDTGNFSARLTHSMDRRLP